MTVAVQVDRLRSLVQDCIAKHLYSTAVFYADKLVTLSGYGPGDVFLLAQASTVLLGISYMVIHGLASCVVTHRETLLCGYKTWC